jgi:hypothetical protein
MSRSDGPFDRGQKCARCKAEMKRLIRIPRASDHPTYDVFECKTCGLVDLVAVEHDS